MFTYQYKKNTIQLAYKQQLLYNNYLSTPANVEGKSSYIIPNVNTKVKWEKIAAKSSQNIIVVIVAPCGKIDGFEARACAYY